MNLFNRQPSCYDRGVCQSTTRQCRQACHEASGEPPIGYEAAQSSNVHQLHADRRAAERALAANRDEEADRPHRLSWAEKFLLMLAGFAVLEFLMTGVLYSLITPDSFLHQLGRAAMSL